MRSRERLLITLEHKEPDRISLDIGAGKACGIHVIAYKNLLDYLGIEEEIKLFHFTAQLAYISEKVYQKLGVDARPVGLNSKPLSYERSPEAGEINNGANYYWFEDEWGRKWKRLKKWVLL